MSPKIPQLSRQQLDRVDKGLRSVWFVAIGAALLLSAFVYFLSVKSPHPLGIADDAEASASAHAAGSMPGH